MLMLHWAKQVKLRKGLNVKVYLDGVLCGKNWNSLLHQPTLGWEEGEEVTSPISISEESIADDLVRLILRPLLSSGRDLEICKTITKKNNLPSRFNMH